METTRKLAFMVTFRAHVNPLKRRGNYSVTSTDMKLVGVTFMSEVKSEYLNL